MPKVTFVAPDGSARTVEVAPGRSVMQAAVENGIDEIEGTCGGVLACATCHVIVDDEWFSRLDPMVANEEAMLDFAEDVHPTSRLGCQIILTAGLDGLVVRLPDA
ncbi:MAG: 2Fe-2S iron-sulfur cluster-binding protein [Rhodospirillales bacterium]